MDKMPNWLDDVVVVNESNDPGVAGDVQIYRNEGDLGRQLEHWYVNDVQHLALTGIGDKAILGVRNKVVIVQRREHFADGPKLLHAWLTSTARHFRSVNAERARKGNVSLGVLETRGILPNGGRAHCLRWLSQVSPDWTAGSARQRIRSALFHKGAVR